MKDESDERMSDIVIQLFIHINKIITILAISILQYRKGAILNLPFYNNIAGFVINIHILKDKYFYFLYYILYNDNDGVIKNINIYNLGCYDKGRIDCSINIVISIIA